MVENLDNAYWDQRYLDDETAWDIGGVSPALIGYFGQLPDRSIPILIPGCGNAYEVSWLLENGFTNVTIIDLSPVLTARLREKFSGYITALTTHASVPGTSTSPPLTILTGDFFELEGQYGLIAEQTFFCALDPSLRQKYVDQMYRLLLPSGKLMGLLFNRDFSGGPPFGGHREEYAALLAGPFTLQRLETCYNSINPRAGSELFFIAEKPVVPKAAPANY